MKYIADLHIHSHFSRATSRQLVPLQLAAWAQRKGVDVIATGDLTHPQWLAELSEALQPAEEAPGLFRLKYDLARQADALVPAACQNNVHFILSGEISSIYKKDGAVRKIHNVVFMPSLEAAAKFQTRLERIGNIRSDGRPILGLDAHDLLEIVLDTDANAHLIPAHIWTPWFSLLGSQSGFDSIEACFGDLTQHIFAVETGLSSNPPMNWRLSMLDRYHLVSNSDAHSPENLAREANIFDTRRSYYDLFAALQNRNSSDFLGTIEFFPEEGKYHMDGHRKCNAMLRPSQTMERNGICPVCGKPVTLGVSYRVEELADRPEYFKLADAKPYHSLVPLPEILAELYDMGVKSKRVQGLYHKLLHEGGAELYLLMNASISDLELLAGLMLGEAIRRMRAGQISAQPGYDGEYGVIRLFKPEERAQWLQQSTLFQIGASPAAKSEKAPQQVAVKRQKKNRAAEPAPRPYGLNAEQAAAVAHQGAALIIQAGPGTGKTRTLTARIAHLLKTGMIQPQQTLAITFTNKAAQEMRERLTQLLGMETAAAMYIQTFHAFGCSLLREIGTFEGREADFSIIDPESDEVFIDEVERRSGEKFTAWELRHIEALKTQLCISKPQVIENLWEPFPAYFPGVFRSYDEILAEWNAVDFNDLILLPVQLLRHDADLRRRLQQRFQAIFVDEFQDIDAAQYELFRIFALAAREVCAIGDPDQAIYGFRGASSEFFQQFQTDFPGARLIRLQRNYRSPQNILSAAHQILQHGAAARSAPLIAEHHAEIKVHIHAASSDRAEAAFIIEKMDELVGGVNHLSMDSGQAGAAHAAYSFTDMAILVRTRRLLPAIEQALARAGIPFRSLNHQRLLGESALSGAVAALHLWLQHKPIALHVRALLQQYEIENEELFNTLCRLIKKERSCAQTDPEQRYGALPETEQNLCKLCEALPTWPQDLALVAILQRIFSFLPERQPDVEAEGRRQLLAKAAEFSGSAGQFLDLLALQRQIDEYDPAAEYVHLLTLHAAKGLEFPVVFIVGCEEGVLPFALADDLEEERRLFYVGMTRAGQQLFLSHAKTRMLQGQLKMQTPSRYLAEFSEKLIRKQISRHKISRRNDQLKLF